MTPRCCHGVDARICVKCALDLLNDIDIILCGPVVVDNAKDFEGKPLAERVARLAESEDAWRTRAKKAEAALGALDAPAADGGRDLDGPIYGIQNDDGGWLALWGTSTPALFSTRELAEQHLVSEGSPRGNEVRVFPRASPAVAASAPPPRGPADDAEMLARIRERTMGPASRVDAAADGRSVLALVEKQSARITSLESALAASKQRAVAAEAKEQKAHAHVRDIIASHFNALSAIADDMTRAEQERDAAVAALEKAEEEHAAALDIVVEREDDLQHKAHANGRAEMAEERDAAARALHPLQVVAKWARRVYEGPPCDCCELGPFDWEKLGESLTALGGEPLVVGWSAPTCKGSAVVKAARELMHSGYDGPWIGDACVPLYSALIALERSGASEGRAEGGEGKR